MTKQGNRYTQILERIFFDHYTAGAAEVPFGRSEIERVAAELKIELPKNPGDILYTFRFRSPFPASISKLAPAGKEWIIRLAGRGLYCFALEREWSVIPNSSLWRIKVPDSTPGIIARYALNDEQALLAQLRYNRLIDVFTGVTCYSLQNHLRTTTKSLGQIETDEIYVGLDRRGAHFVFPVQAKGGKDRMGIVQIEQDIALCETKFPTLICRPIGAQFLPDGGIALFEFISASEGLRIASEKHYQLVPPDKLTNEDLDLYRRATE